MSIDNPNTVLRDNILEYKGKKYKIPGTFCLWVGIGENSTEAIRRLKKWSTAYKGHEFFSFCHIDKEDNVATLPLEETKMAVVLFDACDKWIREMVMHIAGRRPLQNPRPKTCVCHEKALT